MFCRRGVSLQHETGLRGQPCSEHRWGEFGLNVFGRHCLRMRFILAYALSSAQGFPNVASPSCTNSCCFSHVFLFCVFCVGRLSWVLQAWISARLWAICCAGVAFSLRTVQILFYVRCVSVSPLTLWFLSLGRGGIDSRRVAIGSPPDMPIKCSECAFASSPMLSIHATISPYVFVFPFR